MTAQRRLVLGIVACIALIALTFVWRSQVLSPASEMVSVASAQRPQATLMVPRSLETSSLPIATVLQVESVLARPSQDATQSVDDRTATLLSAVAESSPTPLPTATPEPRWLDLGDEGVFEIVGHIQIPALGADEVIVPVSWSTREVDGQLLAVWDTVKGAVGFHRGSAPIGGPGNTVLSGHTRGDGQGEFQNLADLAPGDEVRLWDAGGQTYRYLVESVVTLQEAGLTLEERQRNAQYLRPTEDTRLTLVTCWPVWSYTHRVIVVAYPG